jgi:3-oxoadipate enol-lactonase
MAVASDSRPDEEDTVRTTQRKFHGVAVFMFVLLAACASPSSTTNRESGFAPVNGTRLYYEVAGTGEAVVLIHGFTLDNRMWDDQFAAFATRYRVIRYDARGFGRSAPITEPFSTADDLRGLLDYLNVKQAHVIGLSMGGRYAIDFTLKYPAMVKSLVPADSGLAGQPIPNVAKELGPAIAAGKKGDVAEAKRIWLSHSMFDPAREQPQVAAQLKQIVDDYSGWHFAQGLGAQELAVQPPAAQRLGEIRAPTLVVIGERDLPDLQVIADKLAKEIPGARKVVIANAGHMANMEAPAQFNRVVLEFLAGVK